MRKRQQGARMRAALRRYEQKYGKNHSNDKTRVVCIINIEI
ncbi:hypothetical protein CAMRE0001_2797 [Campylobacter rectus RM3267]|uniref:Uncharacterized protein n=1 Tax=Campylobacter rectus RM3267 TaxID=553218 RepID=B9D0Z0_CAMRE|nr:hypothetical protein CAMRE0001_2797 [Campylobacter rectus RM3267]